VIFRQLVCMMLAAAFAPHASHAGSAPEPGPSTEETRRVSSIDFYGVRSLDAQSLRQMLMLHEGDMLTRVAADAFRDHPETLLPAMPQVSHVQVSYVCCSDQGGIAVFIGVDEAGSRHLILRPKPAGEVRLTEDLVKAHTEVEAALFRAVQIGRAQEDDTEGHALLTSDPEGRAAQLRLIPLVARNLTLLRRVLRESAADEHRARAAALLGYARDKQAVVQDLVRAITDNNDAVRNNAVRALAVFSAKQKDPPRVPFKPIIALLDSSMWTDLNKASFALLQISARRDPMLIAALDKPARQSLADIARWHSRNHALPGYLILGRIAGLTDTELFKRWQENDTEGVIRAALNAP
jgi:HEAT repeats